MLRTHRNTLLAVAVLALLTAPAQAAFVDARAMIYQAGGNLPPSAVDPVLFPVVSGPDQAIIFPGITGTTDCHAAGDDCLPTGPEGNLGAVATISAVNALSGIVYRGWYSLPLMGVFLGPTLPGVAPVGRDFSHWEDFVHLFPTVGQVFWIGDGLNGTGAGLTQIFHVPAGATRLFVGFIDPVPNDNGDSLWVLPAVITTSGVSGSVGTARATWFAASPNPTRGSTGFRFALASSGHASLTICDIAGRRVRTITDEPLASGEHVFDWDGRDEQGVVAPAGVYLSQLRLDGRPVARRTLVVAR
jgi:hypothetical protein